MYKKKIISSIIITLLLFSTIFITGCMEDGEESPKDVIKAMIEDMNDNDYRDALNNTDLKFNKTLYNHMLENFEEDNPNKMEINEITVKHKEDMNESLKENVQDHIPMLEENLSVEVDDFRSLKVNMTNTDEDKTEENTFVALKIDSEWYISFYLLLSVEDVEQDDSKTVAMSGRIRKVQDGWIVEIDSGTVEWSNDIITLYNTTNDHTHNVIADAADYKDTGMGYDLDDEGTEDISVTWNDNNADGEITGGDTFFIKYKDDATIPKDQMDHYAFRLKGTSLQYLILG